MENLIVKKTDDYSLFTNISSNRQINLNHVNNIMRSMDENGVLINPVIVNENYEVIDGQHRLRACIELDLPVYYLLVSGYHINEVHALNLNQKNWSNQDYLEAYAKEGNVNYQRLLKFRNKNNTFAFYTIMNFVTGVSSTDMKDTYRNLNNKQRKQKGNGFKEGRMIISELDIIRAQKLADRVFSLRHIFKDYNHSPFIYVLVLLMNNVKEFDFNQFKDKAEKYRDKIYKCTNRPAYYQMIHELYNFRQKTRINLFNPTNRS